VATPETKKKSKELLIKDNKKRIFQYSQKLKGTKRAKETRLSWVKSDPHFVGAKRANSTYRYVSDVTG
jgi:hypothetical protein